MKTEVSRIFINIWFSVRLTVRPYMGSTLLYLFFLFAFYLPLWYFLLLSFYFLFARYSFLSFFGTKQKLDRVKEKIETKIWGMKIEFELSRNEWDMRIEYRVRNFLGNHFSWHVCTYNTNYYFYFNVIIQSIIIQETRSLSTPNLLLSLAFSWYYVFKPIDALNSIMQGSLRKTWPVSTLSLYYYFIFFGLLKFVQTNTKM